MTLTLGSRLGPYEILSALGAGGMGEVYRAHDTKLNRDVAIKVLLPTVANDPDRLARFSREAQVLASLNHPQIAQIHGLEEANGVRALVMELVEGPTLADRIATGPIPLAEALPIARQIAEALEAAHEKNIIHRDVKPANIKIATDGKVKVLDFGLAKVRESSVTPMNPSQSPTLMTAAAGMILGTAAYMSPEQAKGREVGRSSDIWAFGCVLYEMLTGKPVFDGETVGEILGGVFKSEPDWNRLPDDVPPGIRKLLRRCLQKETIARFRDAGDVRIEIEETLAAPNPADIIQREPAAGSRLPWIVLAAFMLVTIGVSIPVYRNWAPKEEVRPIRFEIPLPPETTLQPGTYASPVPTISPDGRYLAFAVVSKDGLSRLFVRNLESLIATPLFGTEGAGSAFPFWSPDSRFIGFFAGGKLKKVAISGGTPQVLCDAPTGQGGAWNRDGVILFESGNEMRRISDAGGPSTVVLAFESGTRPRWPAFLPDGNHFLFLALNSVPGHSEIRAAALAGGVSKSIINVRSMPRYASPGFLLFVQDGGLMAQPFNNSSLKLTGELTRIAEAVPQNPTLGSAPFSSSDHGTLVYRSGESVATKLVWFDRAGNATLEPVEGNNVNAQLSPNGNRIVFSRHDANGSDLWIRDLVRGTDTKLTFDPAFDSGWPIWSADGRKIVFSSRRSGKSELYTKAADGGGPDEPLHQVAGGPNEWMADGSILFTIAGTAEAPNSTSILPAGGGQAFSVLKDRFIEYKARLSPDRKFIAYTSDQSGREEVYVQTFPTGGGRWQVSVNGGEWPFWRGDGKELFFTTNDQRVMAVDIALSPTFKAGVPKQLFQVQGHVYSDRYSVSLDGQRFLFAITKDEGAATTITTVLNWTAALKR